MAPPALCAPPFLSGAITLSISLGNPRIGGVAALSAPTRPPARHAHSRRPAGSRPQRCPSPRCAADGDGGTAPSFLFDDYRAGHKTLAQLTSSGSAFPWTDAFDFGWEREQQTDSPPDNPHTSASPLPLDFYQAMLSSAEIIELVGPMMSDERLTRIEAVCARRTFNVLPVLESPYDWGNVAAVCRSADALGIGALHVVRGVQDDERYKQSARTAGGSDKWLDVQLFSDTRDCLQRAKAAGFQIAAAHVGQGARAMAEVDWRRPTAIVFGNELRGVSETVLELADVCFSLPMEGFVESYNLSVAAALTLWEARRVRGEGHADLNQDEQRILKAVMCLRQRGGVPQHISELLRRRPPHWQGERLTAAAQRSRGGGRGARWVDPGGKLPPLGSTCYFWDGAVCWGERLLFPGKPCRYCEAHQPGYSTLNVSKLRQRCESKGVQPPVEIGQQAV